MTLLAVLNGLAFTDRRARTALAFGIAGVWLSFGPALPGYGALYRAVPLLQGIRSTARFGYLAIVAAAILSGFSLAWLRAKWPAARWMTAVTAGLVLLANVDALVAPVGYVNASPISDVHNRLRLSSHAVVAELPFAPPESIFRNGQYLLDSTRHFRPMLNGYSGLLPDDYGGEYEELKGFPDGRSIEALRRAGVTHVFVHYPALESVAGTGAVAAVRQLRDLQLIAADDEVGLYALRTAGGPS